MRTVLTEQPVSSPNPVPPRRWSWLAPAIPALLVLAGAVVVVTMSVGRGDHRAGPIEGGSFGGIYSPRNLVLSFRHDTGRIVTTPGATAQLLASLDNRGALPAIVTSIDTDAVTSAIRWSVYRTVPGGAVSGQPTRWRDFPAVVPANGTIRLLATIHRPAYCQGRPMTPGAGGFYSGMYRVHWTSELQSRTTTIDTMLDSYNIQVC